MIFCALFAGENDRGHQYIVEGRLEPIFVAVPDDNFSRARLIELEQTAVVIVIVLTRAIVSEQHREEAQRRNIVAGDLQASSQGSGEQQSRKSPQPSPEHRRK